MRYLSYILLISFSTLVFAPAQAQWWKFWKKKEYHTKATSGKITKPDATEYRDAFSRKSKKGPNIKTKRKPIIKTKKRMHKHATSRKTKKPGSKKFFKPKYSKARVKNKSGDTFSRNARRTKKNSQKGGGKGNGVFKGRKK